jgi:hypothetical protein
MEDVKKLNLKITSLSERFASKVVAYEDEIANIRIEATLLFEELNNKITELQGELDSLRETES